MPQPAGGGAMTYDLVMPSYSTADLAATAARLVVESGLEYGPAKRRAARDLGLSRPEMPSNEQVEDAVREELALFHADTQPTELRALREVALLWLDRLAEFRPHLGGAVWRGTATRLSAVHIDLYADDVKAPEIALINRRVDYDSSSAPGPRPGQERLVLTVATTSAALGELVTVHLEVHDTDALRGALLPDAQSRSWRGDAAALRRLLDEQIQTDKAAP
jgi:hypothetical protein